MTNLAQLKSGQKAKIISLGDDSTTTLKLMSLGLIPGDTLKVVSCAPFGGPQVVRHGDSLSFAIRKELAKKIEVELWSK